MICYAYEHDEIYGHTSHDVGLWTGSVTLPRVSPYTSVSVWQGDCKNGRVILRCSQTYELWCYVHCIHTHTLNVYVPLLMIHHLTWALPLEYSNVPDGDCSRNEDEWDMLWHLAKCMMNVCYVSHVFKFFYFEIWTLWGMMM